MPMLLPPDLRDWVPEDDLVHFVIEAIEQMPMTAFHINYRGTGSKQYSPRMMLALLVYCYANGIFLAGELSGPLIATSRPIPDRRLASRPRYDLHLPTQEQKGL